eukprot:3648768-Amphidinium_carterae.1
MVYLQTTSKHQSFRVVLLKLTSTTTLCNRDLLHVTCAHLRRAMDPPTLLCLAAMAPPVAPPHTITMLPPRAHDACAMLQKGRGNFT